MADFLTLAQYRMYNDGDHMDGWGWGMGVLMILAIVAIVVLVVWLVRSTSQHQHHATAIAGGSAAAVSDTPQQILERRLAQGEITPDEFRERVAVLRGDA